MSRICCLSSTCCLNSLWGFFWLILDLLLGFSILFWFFCCYFLLGMLWIEKKSIKLPLFPKEHIVLGNYLPLLTFLSHLMQWRDTLLESSLLHQWCMAGMEECLQWTIRIPLGITYCINTYLGKETASIRCIYIHASVMNSSISRHSVFGAWPSNMLESNMVVPTLGCWFFAGSREAELMTIFLVEPVCCEGSVIRLSWLDNAQRGFTYHILGKPPPE